MRNLSVIKGLYQGNGVTRRWAIPFEYNDTAQIFVTITTYDEGDYTYRVLDSTEYTIDEDSVEIVYPKTDEDAPIPSTQYLTVWRDTDLLQLMDLTNQGAAWPDSIEASLDKLHQIVQELAEGLSRSLKVDIGDPQTPDEKLVAIQDYVLAAAESSRSASASEANAQRSAEAAATSAENAAESERLASGYADTASDAASRAEDSAISARAYNAPDYDNETTYQVGDVVTYTDGNSYRALQETTGNEPPNIIYWQKVTDYVGDNFFEIDEYGYIVPMDSPSHSRYWRIDQYGYIVPIEGGDGGYRPDTRSLSAEYLNVTNEGYIKYLRADDISAQEVDADEVTAEVAAFNTLTANAVNAGTVTANSASVTEISAGKVIADDVIAKGPVVDVRAFGAVGDGVHDDTAAFTAAINMATDKTLLIPAGNYSINNNLFADSVRKIYDDGFYINIKPVYNNSLKLWQGNLGAAETVANLELVNGGSVQGMTYNPNLNIFLVGVDAGDDHTYIETYNANTFVKLNTYQHDELSHVNSLDYMASENKIITGNSLYLSADGSTVGANTGVRDGAICYDATHKLFFMNYGSRLVDIRNYDNSVLLKTVDTSIYTEITDTMFNGMLTWNDELIISGTQNNKLYFFNMKNGLTYEGTVTIPVGEFEDLCIKGDYLYAITAAGLIIRMPIAISVGVCPSAEYHVGDSIKINKGAIYIGHVTAGKKSLAIFIPLPKTLSGAITGAQVNFSAIYIRHAGYIADGASQSVFYLDEVLLKTVGLNIVLKKQDSSDFGDTNNVVCSVEFRDLMIEFT